MKSTNPNRVWAVFAAMVAIVVGWSIFQLTRDTAPQPATSSPQPSLIVPGDNATGPSATPSSEPSDASGESEGQDSTTRAQTVVVNAWVKAWLTPGDEKVRTAALKPWGIPQAVQTGALVDSSKLPEATVDAVWLDPGFSATREGLAIVTLTDESEWHVALIKDENAKGGWLVRYIIPAQMD